MRECVETVRGSRSQSLFFWIKKRGEKKTRERILNGYLLRSVDYTSERSDFNHEKGKQMLFYVILQSRATDHSDSKLQNWNFLGEIALRNHSSGVVPNYFVVNISYSLFKIYKISNINLFSLIVFFKPNRFLQSFLFFLSYQLNLFIYCTCI